MPVTNSASTTRQPGAASGVVDHRHRCTPDDGDAPPPRAAAPATIAVRVLARMPIFNASRLRDQVLATGSGLQRRGTNPWKHIVFVEVFFSVHKASQSEQ